MRRHCFYYSLCVTFALLLLSACGGKKSSSEERHTVAEEEVVPDSSLMVRLLDVRDDSIYLEELAHHQRRTLCYGRAQLEGRVKGSLEKGDTLSVLPNSHTHHADAIINISELTGRWFYDHSQHRGFEFGPDGALSSINMEQVSFRNWFVKNGNLVIHYVDMQQAVSNGRQYWVDHARIERLSKDELVLAFKDTLYQCRHEIAPVKCHLGM